MDVMVRAPGRANLIGEHTDYNGGSVLPVALELSTYVAGIRDPRLVELRSLDMPGRVRVDLRTGILSGPSWGRYAAGVIAALRDQKVAVGGLKGVIGTELPLGAGLSSSAALMVAVATAVALDPMPPLEVARACRRAENEHVGVATGLMDPLASAGCRRGHGLLIDCLTETTRHVPIPPGLLVLVIDSGVRRRLEEGRYNQRREECLEAARRLGVSSLAAASVRDLEERGPRLPSLLLRRARHVISENERVRATVAAFEERAWGRVGAIFRDSHRSLRDDFQVSTKELDRLVEIAAATESVVASRLTGAGWGGCTVSLVRSSEAGAVASEITARFGAETGRRVPWWLSAPAAGAEKLPPRQPSTPAVPEAGLGGSNRPLDR